jgi:hypothetical protein
MLSGGAMSVTKQWATVLVTIGAWLVLSNHCALGLGDTAKSDLESDGCPMHSAPAKEKPAGFLPCCKDLHALAPHAVKNIGAAASQFLGVQDCATVVVLTPPHLTMQVLALETGPPLSPSFAESVLQRSLLAHAPPAGFARL